MIDFTYFDQSKMLYGKQLRFICPFIKSFWHSTARYFNKKRQIYVVQGNCLNCFKSYLTNKKKYIDRKDFKKVMLNIKYSVPLRPLLLITWFVYYVNDLFADDTIL